MKYFIGTAADTFKDNSQNAKPSFMLAFYGSTGTLLFIYEDNDDLAGVLDVEQPIEHFKAGSADIKALVHLVKDVRAQIDKVIHP